jgi:two-component system, OmpR family, sensor kinase
MVAAFGVIAALLGGLQIIQYVEQRDMQRGIEHIQKHTLVSVRLIGRIAVDVQREQVLLTYHVFEKGSSKMGTLEERLQAVRDDYRDAASEYAPHATRNGEWFVWDQLEREVDAVRHLDDRALDLSRANRDAEAASKLLDAKPLFDAIGRKASALVDINEVAVNRAAVNAAARHRRDAWIQHALTAGILVVVVLGGYWVTRHVVHAQRDLERVNGKLETKNRELDAFAGRVAHDLRNPLNAIQLTSERLTLQLPQSASLTEPISRSVMRIGRLIDDLLLLSRSRVATPKPTPTMQIGFSIEQDLAPIVEAANGTLRVSLEPAEILCTEGLLKQALCNLGENAMKYHRADVAPVVEMLGRVDVEYYSIQVSDNGIGMTTDETSRVFEPFFRGERVRAIPGTGLGLSIVQRVVEADGGQITLSSRPEQGTTFVIALPLARRGATTA